MKLLIILTVYAFGDVHCTLVKEIVVLRYSYVPRDNFIRALILLTVYIF